MRLIVTADNKSILQLTCAEWQSIGEENGWLIEETQKADNNTKASTDEPGFLTKYFANASFFKLA